MSNSSENNKHPVKRHSFRKRLRAFLKRIPQNKEQLMEVLREAEKNNILSTEMLGMVERILQVSEMQVREVMIPKSQMVVIEHDSTLETSLPIMIESGHSRFPVTDQSGKDIIGILLAKDCLKFCFGKKAGQFNITQIMRLANFVPQSKRLDILLREFRINRNHLAIVLDEYGQVAGLVTIEDVLEQIVGEIEDEYDIDEENGHIKQLEDGSCIVKAGTTIEEFNEYFHTDFSNVVFDTIGGIVLKEFGHFPKRGESIKIGKLRFKVLHNDNRRIHLLEVKLQRSQAKG